MTPASGRDAIAIGAHRGGWAGGLMTLLAIDASALARAAGFGIHALRHWPVLTQARLDGKPG